MTLRKPGTARQQALLRNFQKLWVDNPADHDITLDPIEVAEGEASDSDEEMESDEE
ncbi:hypothetical protein DFP72DRAFT_1069182 [Ephemerocybe angulata]|uniref:Uncharacterized protein n=1 Tax=Ephemerocybe angulata TaxID=980116 RepID=A0A8H6HW25_9AGAR|nr:hypothetical protein DFP72DRAFT_1069182 [Tulosesus angulatus]